MAVGAAAEAVARTTKAGALAGPRRLSMETVRKGQAGCVEAEGSAGLLGLVMPPWTVAEAARLETALAGDVLALEAAGAQRCTMDSQSSRHPDLPRKHSRHLDNERHPNRQTE